MAAGEHLAAPVWPPDSAVAGPAPAAADPFAAAGRPAAGG